MSKRFYQLMRGIEALDLCKNRQTFQFLDIVVFYYARAAGSNIIRQNGIEVIRHIAYSQMPNLSPNDLVTMTEYFFDNAVPRIRRAAVNSLFRCLNITLSDEMFQRFMTESRMVPRGSTKNDDFAIVLAALDDDYDFTLTAEVNVMVIKFILVFKPWTVTYASDELLDNMDIVRFAISRDGSILRSAYIPDRIKNDKASVIIAVTSGEGLEYAPSSLRDDKEVVLTAVKSSGDALFDASSRLKGDKEVVLAAVSESPYALQFASSNLQDDKDVVTRAVMLEPSSIRFASRNMKDDRDIGYLVITSQSSETLLWLSPRLRGDRNIVLKAVTSFGWNFLWADEKFGDDKEIVMRASMSRTKTFKGYTNLLSRVSPRLQDDRDVVLSEVQKDGYALLHASSRLRDDPEVVMTSERLMKRLKRAYDR